MRGRSQKKKSRGLKKSWWVRGYSYAHAGHVPGIVTLARAELDAPTTGTRTLAELAPGPPAPVLLDDVGGQPDAVALEAVLRSGGRGR